MLLKLGSSFSDCDRNLRVRWRTLNIICSCQRHRAEMFSNDVNETRDNTHTQSKKEPGFHDTLAAEQTWTKESVANKLDDRSKMEIWDFLSSQNKEMCIGCACETMIRTQNQNSPFFFCVCMWDKREYNESETRCDLPARVDSAFWDRLLSTTLLLLLLQTSYSI